jgi:hypothetical protein
MKEPSRTVRAEQPQVALEQWASDSARARAQLDELLATLGRNLVESYSDRMGCMQRKCEWDLTERSPLHRAPLCCPVDAKAATVQCDFTDYESCDAAKPDLRYRCVESGPYSLARSSERSSNLVVKRLQVPSGNSSSFAVRPHNGLLPCGQARGSHAHSWPNVVSFRQGPAVTELLAFCRTSASDPEPPFANAESGLCGIAESGRLAFGVTRARLRVSAARRG